MLQKSLKVKFVIYLTPLILLIASAFLFFYLFRSNYSIKEQLTESGFHLAKDLSYSSQLAVAAEDPVLLQPSLEGLFEEEEVLLVAVYNKSGHIIVSESKREIEERMPSDVWEELSKGGGPLKKLSQTKDGEKIYDFYSPILIKKTFTPFPTTEAGKLAGFARVSLSLEKIQAENRIILFQGLTITGLVILLGFFVSIFLAERLVKPIKLLTGGTEEIARGNLDYQFDIKTGDEIEDLAKSFNQMINSLRKSRKEIEEARDILEVRVGARTKELQELANSLDEQVKKRTVELQERIDELERFHKLTVGRELKMIQLKEELQRLEKKREIFKEKEPKPKAARKKRTKKRRSG